MKFSFLPRVIIHIPIFRIEFFSVRDIWPSQGQDHQMYKKPSSWKVGCEHCGDRRSSSWQVLSVLMSSVESPGLPAVGGSVSFHHVYVATEEPFFWRPRENQWMSTWSVGSAGRGWRMWGDGVQIHPHQGLGPHPGRPALPRPVLRWLLLGRDGVEVAGQSWGAQQGAGGLRQLGRGQHLDQRRRGGGRYWGVCWRPC